MSEIVTKIMFAFKAHQYVEITEADKAELTKLHLDTLGQAHRFLNGVKDKFYFRTDPIRVALFYLDHLVLNGCSFYECYGDVLVTHADATRGRCVKCGKEVVDYRV